MRSIAYPGKNKKSVSPSFAITFTITVNFKIDPESDIKRRENSSSAIKFVGIKLL